MRGGAGGAAGTDAAASVEMDGPPWDGPPWVAAAAVLTGVGAAMGTEVSVAASAGAGVATGAGAGGIASGVVHERGAGLGLRGTGSRREGGVIGAGSGTGAGAVTAAGARETCTTRGGVTWGDTGRCHACCSAQSANPWPAVTASVTPQTRACTGWRRATGVAGVAAGEEGRNAKRMTELYIVFSACAVLRYSRAGLLGRRRRWSMARRTGRTCHSSDAHDTELSRWVNLYFITTASESYY